MLQALKPYWAYTKASFIVGFAYRLHIIFWVLSDVVQVTVMMLIWVAIYASGTETSLQGFTLSQMLIYNLIIYMTASFTYMKPLFDLADDHYDGKIAMSLIKPTQYLYEVFFRNLGGNFVGDIVISIPLVSVLIFVSATMNTQVQFTLSSVLLYLVSILLAIVISFFSNFIFAMSVFLIDAYFGLMQLNEAIVRIFSGSLIPLAFFPAWLRTIAHILPYASIYTIPTLILMNRYTSTELWTNLGIQLAWAIGLVLATQLLWNNVMAKVKVHGG